MGVNDGDVVVVAHQGFGQVQAHFAVSGNDNVHTLLFHESLDNIGDTVIILIAHGAAEEAAKETA